MNDNSWQLEILHPLRLAALAVALPLFYYSWRSLVQAPRRRRAASLCVRMLLLVTLVAALCDIRITGMSHEPFVVAAVDRSASISAAARFQADEFLDDLARAANGQPMSVLPFAAQPGHSGENLPPPDPLGTDIAAAVAAVRAAVPADYVPRIVLLTDGNETSGNLCAAAKAADVPVSVVPLPGSAADEVYAAVVRAPAQVRAGDAFEVNVIVWSAKTSECRVQLFAGAKPLADRQVRLAAGDSNVEFRLSFVGQSPVTLTAHVASAGDTTPENNEAGAQVLLTPPPSALLVTSCPDSVAPLSKSLDRSHIRAEVLAPDAMPDRADLLHSYDLLVLANVPAVSLSQNRMKAIQAYVRRGGGLIVLGGDHALTPGGYHGTALEDVLPLACEPTSARPRPTLAMVLVLDCSGSMQGEKMQLAKLAIRQAVETLSPRDTVGVLAFEARTRWASPLQKCAGKEAILHDIEKVEAGGGTKMYPALEQAYAALRKASADIRHVLLLTDGISVPGDFAALAQKIGDAHIGTSIVGLGADADRKLLQAIADKSKGRCYFCENAQSLPQVFVAETRAAGKVGVVEGPCTVHVVQPDTTFANIDFGHAPALTGYVEMRLKPTGRLWLASESSAPLLAAWRYGEGRSAVFTSDLEGQWSAAWLRWGGFEAFWTQLARSVLRPANRTPQNVFGKSTSKYPRELAFRPTNVELLRSVAQQTGGQYAPAAAELFAAAKNGVPWTRDLRPILLTVALLIFLIDFAIVRRWAGD
jgi:Ca-activated chloride channel homolog